MKTEIEDALDLLESLDEPSRLAGRTLRQETVALRRERDEAREAARELYTFWRGDTAIKTYHTVRWPWLEESTDAERDVPEHG